MTNLDTIKALNDLYVYHRYKYLKQANGDTYTVTAGKEVVNSKTNGKFKTSMLNDSLLKDHLLGKATYGVFANNKTKFMIFDFDFAADFQLCKWYFYKIQYALIEMEIAEQYIYATNSGGKGLHLHIYFENPITVENAKAIYKRALQVADVEDMSRQIEFRPTNNQGVKLPLGYHFKTGNKSCFVNKINVDEPLPDETIFNINKISDDIVFVVLDIQPSRYDLMNDEQIQEAAKTELYANVNELDIYKLGQDEQYTASYYNDLYSNGLKARNTRHNVTFRLAIYLKDYYGMDQEGVFKSLLEWLYKQDKQLYTSTLDEAVKDTDRIVADVFEKDYKLQIQQSDIHISVDELRTILTARKIDNSHFTHNQKLVLFSLLIHSKRYTDGTKKIFYMSYNQMTQVTNITNRRALQNAITQFEEIGLITIHRRNAPQAGTYIKSVNQYELLFTDDAALLEIEINIDKFRLDNKLFDTLISTHFSSDELKTILSRRQFSYYKSINIS